MQDAQNAAMQNRLQWFLIKSKCVGSWLGKRLSLITWFLLVWFFIHTMKENKRWNDFRIISNDVISYYAYLPAIFIHHDIKLDFVKKDRDYYLYNCQFWPESLPNGGLLIKTTMGMSLLYSPFFFIAHNEALNTGQVPNGFSDPYHRWICIGCLLYSIIGLWYLRWLLLRYFSEAATAITMILVGVGSNYFFYATEETMLTHNISFMLIAAFAYYTTRWYELFKWKYAVALGIFGGLILLVRPTNLLVCVFFILFGIGSFQQLGQRLKLLWNHRIQLLVLLFIALLIFFPQLLYWKYVAGHWFTNPYTTERFYFNNPHVIDGLFSYRKGWILYSPVMIFSLLGLYALYKQQRQLMIALIVFLSVHLYMTFSWWDWWYGGSFGARALVDITPLFCLPFAAFFQWLFTLKKYRVVGVPIMAFAVFCVVFFQVANFQYRHGMLHYVSMTKEAYWYLFLKTEFTESDVVYLNSVFKLPDYEKAKLGLDE